jgi:hypothetical protein
MQGPFLGITLGIEIFLLVGFLFYLVFRTYAEGEDRVSMMRWVIGLIGILTLGLIVSVTLVATRMATSDLVVATALLIVDVIGLYLLIDDTQRITRTTTLVEKA